MDEFETIEEISDEMVEERKTLKDILVEMKDLSEVTTDLAYSAVLLNSKELAEEVLELEEEMDKLRIEAEIKAMLSVRNQEDAEDMIAMLHIAHAAETMSDAAVNIVDVVLRGEGDHPILRGMLTEAEETTTKTTVSDASLLVNKSLGELRLGTRTGMFVVAIKRGKRWMYQPKKTLKIKAGDLLISVGPRDSVATLKDISSGKIKDLD